MEEEKEKNMDFKNTHLSSLNFSISYPHVCINYRLGTSFYKYKVWNYSFPCQPWEVGNYRLSAQKNIHNIHPDYKSFFFPKSDKNNNTNTITRTFLLPFARDPPILWNEEHYLMIRQKLIVVLNYLTVRCLEKLMNRRRSCRIFVRVEIGRYFSIKSTLFGRAILAALNQC